MVQASIVFIFDFNIRHIEGSVGDHYGPIFIAICDRLCVIFRHDFLNCFEHFDDDSTEVCYNLHISIV
jgi:hypothetical protein